MIRIIAKLFAATLVLAAFLYVGPLHAAPFAFVANGGSGVACTSAAPCATIANALGAVDGGGEIICLDSTAFLSGGSAYSFSLTIDCPGVFLVANNTLAGLTFNGTNQVVTIRNLTIRRASGAIPAVTVQGSGTLILENCVFDNFPGSTALDIEPNGPFNLVVTNSRISNSGAGVLIKPAAGGRVTAAFNGVTIANNTGGGLKTDSTNGLIEVDVSNSTISNNAGNGMNAVGGAGGSNILNLAHNVIASNGTAGIQANGSNAAVFVDTTLLDLNNIAISTVNSGKVFTYGNNRTIGNSGSGFTGPAALQ